MKEELFREVVTLYEANEGSFVANALAHEKTATGAVARMLDDVAEIYTRPGRPHGCSAPSRTGNCPIEPTRRFWARRLRLCLSASRCRREMAHLGKS